MAAGTYGENLQIDKSLTMRRGARMGIPALDTATIMGTPASWLVINGELDANGAPSFGDAGYLESWNPGGAVIDAHPLYDNPILRDLRLVADHDGAQWPDGARQVGQDLHV